MPSALAAVGVMLERVRNHRNDIVRHRGAPKSALLDRPDLENFCVHQRQWKGDPKSKLKQLFAGWPPSDGIGQFTPELLRFVLLGLPGETSVPTDLQSEMLDEAERIVRAFFANSPYLDNPDDVNPRDAHDVRPEGVWYFWPFARKLGRSLHVRHTFTSAEALIEMEWLRREVAQGRAVNARMTRVFAEVPFRMVDMSKRSGQGRPCLTRTGEEAIRCLRSGIDQVAVFPEASIYSRDPQASAEAFRTWALERKQAESWPTQAGRVHLVSIGCTAATRSQVLNRMRYGWEHLVPHQNITYYQWDPIPSHKESEERLSYSRHPRHGPCTFEPDDHERLEFRDWFDLFVLPRLDATGTLSITSAVPPSIEKKSAKRPGAQKKARPR